MRRIKTRFRSAESLTIVHSTNIIFLLRHRLRELPRHPLLMAVIGILISVVEEGTNHKEEPLRMKTRDDLIEAAPIGATPETLTDREGGRERAFPLFRPSSSSSSCRPPRFPSSSASAASHVSLLGRSSDSLTCPGTRVELTQIRRRIVAS